jgi:hypothetical protein
MSADASGDLLFRNLARLPTAEPDVARTRRTQIRCHAAIAHQLWRAERASRRRQFGRQVIEPALVGGLCAIYLLAVIAEVLTRSVTL